IWPIGQRALVVTGFRLPGKRHAILHRRGIMVVIRPMGNRLQMHLLPDWSDHSHENPDGPPTYLRDTSEVPGPLQVSWAWYESGEVPNPSDEDLISLATGAQRSFE